MPAEGRGFSSEPTSKVGKDRRLGNLATPISVQRLQTALHAKAKGELEFRFHALYDKIYRIDVLEYAYGLITRTDHQSQRVTSSVHSGDAQSISRMDHHSPST